MLIADDDLALGRTMVRLLERFGHEVVVVSTTDALRVALDSGAFGLLVVDVNMPRARSLNPLEVLSRSRRRDLPVIVISGDPGAVNQLARAGARASSIEFMTKPLDPSEFLRRVEQRLGSVENGG